MNAAILLVVALTTQAPLIEIKGEPNPAFQAQGKAQLKAKAKTQVKLTPAQVKAQAQKERANQLAKNKTRLAEARKRSGAKWATDMRALDLEMARQQAMQARAARAQAELDYENGQTMIKHQEAVDKRNADRDLLRDVLRRR